YDSRVGMAIVGGGLGWQVGLALYPRPSATIYWSQQTSTIRGAGGGIARQRTNGDFPSSTLPAGGGAGRPLAGDGSTRRGSDGWQERGVTWRMKIVRRLPNRWKRSQRKRNLRQRSGKNPSDSPAIMSSCGT